MQYLIFYTYAFKFIGIVWYLDACGKFDITNSLIIPENWYIRIVCHASAIVPVVIK